jgi:hypothetical protein
MDAKPEDKSNCKLIRLSKIDLRPSGSIGGCIFLLFALIRVHSWFVFVF